MQRRPVEHCLPTSLAQGHALLIFYHLVIFINSTAHDTQPLTDARIPRPSNSFSFDSSIRCSDSSRPIMIMYYLPLIIVTPLHSDIMVRRDIRCLSWIRLMTSSPSTKSWV
jgi:hypothetical protein